MMLKGRRLSSLLLSLCTSAESAETSHVFFGRLNVTFLGQALWNINKILAQARSQDFLRVGAISWL